MNKKIKTNNTDLRVGTSTAMIVKVGSFKFVQEEDYPWIDVFITGNESDELIEQINDEVANSVIDIKDLEVFAVNWVFENVEIVKEMTAPEVPVQERPQININKLRVQNGLEPILSGETNFIPKE
jgi:hypothetical protein